MSTCSQCFYNKWIGSSDLTSCPTLKDSQGASFSYGTVSLKPSLLASHRQGWSVPQRQVPAELLSSSPDSHWSWRTGARRRTDGCGRPSSGHLWGWADRHRWASCARGGSGVEVRWTQTGTSAWRAREIRLTLTHRKAESKHDRPPVKLQLDQKL